MIWFFFKNIWLGITLAAPIGPVSIEVIKRGLGRGFKSAAGIGIGACIGDIFYLTVCYWGLAPFMTHLAMQLILGFLGALMLVYLGVQSIRAVVNPHKLYQPEKNHPILVGIILSVLNPFTITWWFGIFGASLAVVDASDFSVNLYFKYWVIILGVFIWFSFLSGFMSYLRHSFRTNYLKYISVIAGINLIGYGIYYFVKTLEKWLI